MCDQQKILSNVQGAPGERGERGVSFISAVVSDDGRLFLYDSESSDYLVVALGADLETGLHGTLSPEFVPMFGEFLPRTAALQKYDAKLLGKVGKRYHNSMRWLVVGAERVKSRSCPYRLWVQRCNLATKRTHSKRFSLLNAL
ncbi:hypothetical protein SARC_04067 [Sphaeroforma arctica JP610]|uniref:Uncharacterized protein n=1 Tax=Sphaeroforma arctica JP610 TaxID=667725 RepID=A0A0L0G670_9EUKA|nr:hypothetical protein SARC_04067 [Sphaeroforma arctica JP610]KNC83708.1 hypothetical protein SARC_04067 [Sphaeroforma arctica JP610]|eukprot:XP_014157610.1 hypothetical protein SARC_04067 [Sphaeroforma arctica JP610]